MPRTLSLDEFDAPYSTPQGLPDPGADMPGGQPRTLSLDQFDAQEAAPSTAPEDAAVGEAIGKAFDDLYANAIEMPARNIAQGYLASASGMYSLGANAMMLINRAGDYLTEKTGVGAMSRDTAFGKAEQWLRRTAQQVAPDAESLDDSTIAKIYQGLGSAPAAIAQYATGTRYLGPVAGFAAVDALHAADQGAEAAAWAGAKGAMLGGAFKAAGPLKRPSRAGALAVIGGTQAAAEGGDVSDVVAGATTLGILGATGPRGRVGIRDLYAKPRKLTIDEFDQRQFTEYAIREPGGVPTGPGRPAERAEPFERRTLTVEQFDAREVAGPTEKLSGASIRTRNGEVFEGRTHDDAIAAGAKAKGKTFDEFFNEHIDAPNPAEQGFVTNTGRFISPMEAKEIASREGQERPEQLEKLGIPAPEKGLLAQGVEFAARTEDVPPPPKSPGAPVPVSTPAPVGTQKVITTRGSEIDVRYELVEADSLIVSHRDDLSKNPAYPQEIQPRQRERAASAQQIAKMAAQLRPELLGVSPKAGGGAPIVGSDGVVESGNGRVLAVRRAYSQGLPGGQKYREWLASQGYDQAAGMREPMLIRRRLTEMTMEQRARFAREANTGTTLGMSSAEQAAADAADMSANLLGQYQGGNIAAAGNRGFVTSFAKAVVPEGEQARFFTGEGRLSQDGRSRIENAMFAKAYGRPDLLSTLREDLDSNIRGLGNALIQAAPAWAQMRGAASRGQIPASLDITQDVLQVIDRIGQARTAGTSPREAMAQIDAFAGEVTPAQQAIFGWFYEGRRPRAWAKVAADLGKYATEASKASTGPNLLGLPGGGNTGAANRDRGASGGRGDAEPGEGFRRGRGCLVDRGKVDRGGSPSGAVPGFAAPGTVREFDDPCRYPAHHGRDDNHLQ